MNYLMFFRHFELHLEYHLCKSRLVYFSKVMYYGCKSLSLSPFLCLYVKTILKTLSKHIISYFYLNFCHKYLM